MSRRSAALTCRSNPSKQTWTWPIDLSQYDRSPELTNMERQALEYLADRWRRFGQASRWPGWVHGALTRFIEPLDKIFARYGTTDSNRWFNPRKVVLLESLARNQAYWGWDPETWFEFVSRSDRGWFKLVYPAYLIGGVRNWIPYAKFQNTRFNIYHFSWALFGRDTIDAAVNDVRHDLVHWGYSDTKPESSSASHVRTLVRMAVSATCLFIGTPFLTDTTTHALEVLRASCLPRHRRTLYGGLGLLSRVLSERGVIEKPLTSVSELRKKDWHRRQNPADVPAEWFDAITRWHQLCTLNKRDDHAQRLMKVGRWLMMNHPEITRPEQFTYNLASELTASICRDWKIGDYISPYASKHMKRKRMGDPLSFQSVQNHLGTLRVFLGEIQEEPFNVRLGFNPRKSFRTPKYIQDGITQQPRTVESRLWARIVYAALNLTGEDMPISAFGGNIYPLEMAAAVAVTWVFSGLRSDEIARLPVGCIELYGENHVVEWTGEVLPKDAVAKLTVPVHKTGPSFVKPVHPIIYEKIKAWEAIRPVQPKQRDDKTGQMIDFLFSIRGRPLGVAYINHSIIPMLSRKAKGISPKSRAGEEGKNDRLADTKGPITSHRARAQIASMLHNGPVPMTVAQIQTWLGHRRISSTAYYAETLLLTENTVYANIEMFDRNLRMVQVYVDTAESGGVRLYYDVGDGLCAFPEWHSCPHRLACLKCQYFVPRDVAVQIRARDGVRRFLEEIPNLTDTERRAADGDERALAELVEQNSHLPPPPKNITFHRPLSVINGVKPPRRS